MTSNSEYKDWVAGVFDRSSADYDRAGPRPFTHFGRGLVEFAGMRPGSHVLDVACGKGAVLIPALDQVGESGEVIGIDISPGMISKLAGALEQRGVSHATVIKMDAEDLRLPDAAFDYVFCGLALFFFPNLGSALDECYRVLKPDGLFFASTLAGSEAPWRDSIFQAARTHRERLAPVPSADTADLDQEAELTAELEAAGFAGIDHQVDAMQFFFHDEAEWWRAQWSIFRRAFMERLDADALEEYKQEVLRIVSEHRTERGIPTTFSVRYSRARKRAGVYLPLEHPRDGACP